MKAEVKIEDIKPKQKEEGEKAKNPQDEETKGKEYPEKIQFVKKGKNTNDPKEKDETKEESKEEGEGEADTDGDESHSD